MADIIPFGSGPFYDGDNCDEDCPDCCQIPERWLNQLRINEMMTEKLIDHERCIMRLERTIENLEAQVRIWQKYCADINSLLTTPKEKYSKWWLPFTRP